MVIKYNMRKAVPTRKAGKIAILNYNFKFLNLYPSYGVFANIFIILLDSTNHLFFLKFQNIGILELIGAKEKIITTQIIDLKSLSFSKRSWK